MLAFLLFPGCKPSGNGRYISGEFSFTYPAAEYTIDNESEDGALTSFFLRSKENPSNRIEFSIYRYEPDFVAKIVPSDLAKEIQIDVMEVGTRATSAFEITDQSGLIIPEQFSLPYQVNALICVRDDDGNRAIVRISSTQIEHYNVITVAWGDSEDTARSYADILSTFHVDTKLE
ncbi:MAG: hypothetical protein IJ623_05190 [Bacteroidales bacterium]|nr:hypothetical protein [Bacteroidales bacterium]